MRNARFWQYINGSYVKLTLQHGQQLNWSNSEATDEGFSAEAYTWELDGEVVQMYHTTSGRDCDGRHSSEQDFFCFIDELYSWIGTDGHMMPMWELEDYMNRDYSAEAMGY